MNSRIRFDRNELAGSFGDIGTDLPLIVGMVLAAGLDSASVFFVFGLLQIATGLVYRLPMPMQPLKAMAVLVITQKLAGNVLFGAGLAIGATMLVLSLSGGLGLLAKWIPRCVVRGIQFGLGLSLASLALKNYIPSMGWHGYAIATASLVVMLSFWGNRRIPPGLLVIAIGVVYALATGLPLGTIADGFAITFPTLHHPSLQDILTGFVVLALPQIPLSISNSVIATEQTIRDLFPQRRVSIRKIGLTYSLVNLVAPFLGGIPACHGCGGLAGHYTFGARTGGSVVIYGAVYLALGLFLSGPLHEVLKVFPQPILGVVLLFEALTLLTFVRDQADSAGAMSIALLVGVVALAVPHGFVVGLVLGSIVFYGFKRFGLDYDELGEPGMPSNTALRRRVAEHTAAKNILRGVAVRDASGGWDIVWRGHHLRVDGQVPVGPGEVELCIRPEDIRLVWPEKAAARANVLRGRIVRELERGLDYVLYVGIGDGSDPKKYDLEIQVPDHLHHLMALHVGKEIFLSLPPDRLHLLAPDE